jgi:hypothetical protein
MPIRKHLTDKTAFGPAAIEAMSKAFEEACIALQVYAGDEKGREIIATRIIDLARNGLIDPTALRDRIIAEARLANRTVPNVRLSTPLRQMLPTPRRNFASFYCRSRRSGSRVCAGVATGNGKPTDRKS